MDLRAHVRDIPDFPNPGVVFKDISPLLGDADALNVAVAGLAELASPLKIDFVVAAEARGFILGGALSRALHAGFVLVGVRAAMASYYTKSTRRAPALRQCTLPANLRGRSLTSVGKTPSRGKF